MARPGPIDAIEEQAIRWASRAEYGDMMPAERAELEAWLKCDRRHQGAFLRARAGLYAMEDAVIGAHGGGGALNDNDVRGGRPEWTPREHGWLGRVAVGMAASLTLAVFGGGLLYLQQSEPRAQGRVLSLADGSTARLAEGATIRFERADGMRKVTLVRGMATFEVAKDKAHPFVVFSGDVSAQATGTVYSVARVGDTGGTVEVKEGKVLVWARDERDQAVLLRAGGKLTLEPGPEDEPSPVPMAKAPVRMPPLPAPQLAQISLDNDRIADAVVRFNRVNETRIVINDKTIGELRIVGLFRANEPERFAKAAAAIAGAGIAKSQNEIVIFMK